MDEFARQSQEIRAELFQETAARMGVAPIIVEKDFWVCWTLKRVFTLEGFQAGLIFKGGTSLSKAYGAIRRFSEDIDLSLDRHDLGFTGDRDPGAAGLSGNRRKALLRELDETTSKTIQTHLKHRIESAMATSLSGIDIDLTVSEENNQTLIFNYPAGVPLPGGDTYLADKVKLEFGARSDHLPAETRHVKSYVAEHFPGQISDAEVRVKTLSATRTFWEKATILHMLYHSPDDKALGKHMSRHYYDLAELAASDVRAAALDAIHLLSDVALHKSHFFRDAKAKYEEAEPPTLRLVPEGELERRLRSDYSSMQDMLFDEPPKFDDILTGLAALEAEINTIKI